MTEKKAKPESVDSYIANAAEAARPKLEELRKIMKSAIPKVEEGISWNVPSYKYHGEIGGFAAFKKHVTFGFGADSIEDRDREVLESNGYKVAKGSMQIQFDQKVPAAVIKKILKAKAKVNEAKKAAK